MRFNYSYVAYGTKVFDKPVTEIIIGRPRVGEKVDLDLNPDIQVSRPHARLSYEQGSYWIEDLESKHGTWVNRKRITERTQVVPGMIIQMGQTTIKLLAETVPMKRIGSSGVTAPFHNSMHTVDEDGMIRIAIDATKHPFPLYENDQPDYSDVQALQHLRAFYDCIQVLSAAHTLDQLLDMLVQQIPHIFPGAQRGAILLRDKFGKLLLKVYWPSVLPSLSMSHAKRACEERLAFFWMIADRAIGQKERQSYHDERAALYVPLLCEKHPIGLIYIDNQETNRAFTLSSCNLLIAIANQTALLIKSQMLQRDQQREVTAKIHFRRQFSPEVTERLLLERHKLPTQGERIAPVTIFMAHICDFSEVKIAPDSMVQMLNELSEMFTSIVFKYKGTIHSCSEEFFVCCFGAPERDDDQWEKALHAAATMQQAMQELGERWRKRNGPVLHIGIGIHTGDVIHGFVGAAERMEYRVIGESVSQTREYCLEAGPEQIVISKEVHEHLFRLVDAVEKVKSSPDGQGDKQFYLIKGLKRAVQG